MSARRQRVFIKISESYLAESVPIEHAAAARYHVVEALLLHPQCRAARTAARTTDDDDGLVLGPRRGRVGHRRQRRVLRVGKNVHLSYKLRRFAYIDATYRGRKRFQVRDGDFPKSGRVFGRARKTVR